MCGSLRREETANLIGKDPQPSGLYAQWKGKGHSFPIKLNDGSSREAEFNGHARQEKLDGWLKAGWKEAELHVAGYTEGRGALYRQYEVPPTHALKCVVREVRSGKLVFNIVTRPAKGREKEIHDRFPVMVRRTGCTEQTCTKQTYPK